MVGVCALLDAAVGGLLHCAPVCSSFVWINSSQHQRGPSLPLGDMSHGHVRDGNLLLERCVLLCVAAFHLGQTFLLEQPRNSQLQLHPCFQMLISHLASHETTLLRNSLSLGEFGGESEKPLWLYSIQPLDLDTPTDLPPSSSGSSDALVTIQYPSWI